MVKWLNGQVGGAVKTRGSGGQFGHRIAAAFRFRLTSSESTRLGFFTSITAFAQNPSTPA
jgi:hypothetical protein